MERSSPVQVCSWILSHIGAGRLQKSSQQKNLSAPAGPTERGVDQKIPNVAELGALEFEGEITWAVVCALEN